MAKVSVIVPIHNDGRYLSQAMDSLLLQKDIEIICVNDASTDHSGEILEKYRKLYPAMKVISHTKNEGTLRSRADGVMAATGEYIMFMDGDDMLERGACEELAARMEQSGADIINFGMNVVASPAAAKATVDNVKRLAAVHARHIRGDRLVRQAFADRTISFSVTNKIFRASLCKNAYEIIPKGNFCVAEDMFISFIIFDQAFSMECIAEAYYIYRVGVGISTRSTMSLEQMRQYCNAATLIDYLKAYLKEKKKFEKLSTEWKCVFDMVLHDCINKWYNALACCEKRNGFDIMVRSWGCEAIGEALVKCFWSQKEQAKIAQWICGAESLAYRKRSVKTIGLFYYRLGNGGIERVITLLSNQWIKQGYRVVIFIDQDTHGEDEYGLSDQAVRIKLPDSFSQKEEDHINRFKVLYENMKSLDIDVLIHNAWMSEVLLWDMLAAKLQGIPYIQYTHGVFSSMLCSGSSHSIQQFTLLPDIYRLADITVTLSPADRTFWSQFCSNVFMVSNPCQINIPTISPMAHKEHTILWVGRISPEKNLNEAVNIMQIVHDAIPDCTMRIVGKADECYQSYYEGIKTAIKDKGLDQCIQFLGYRGDIENVYAMADIILVTSEYEGYSLVIAESKLMGKPAVMYDLPYNVFCAQKKGLLTVPPHDVAAAGDQIIQLFKDPQRMKKLSEEAKESSEIFHMKTISDQWNEMFALISKHDLKAPDTTGKGDLILTTMMDHLSIGMDAQMKTQRSNTQTAAPSQIPWALQYQGRGKKLITGLFCLKHYGLKQTYRIFKDKLGMTK